jgi:large subunit ribosomal protein L10
VSADATGDRRTETIPQWKRDEVDALVDLIEAHDSVGVVDVTGIPSRQLQTMRRNLHGTATLRVSRNTLLERALDAVGDGLGALADHVSGQVGLIVTDDNPFGLFRELEASKSPAPIGAGEVAPNDIVIPEGDTGVDPGPFVGELQNVGAAAQIQSGSIHVTADSTVCEAGEVVSEELEGVLGELGIEPKEVGLDLRAVPSDGVVFDPEDLDIDVGAYRADVRTAAARGRNLSVNAAHPTDATVRTLLAIASGDVRGLGLSAGVATPGLASDLLARADADLRALAGAIDDPEALPEALRDVGADDEPSDDTDDSDDADASGADEAQGDDQDSSADEDADDGGGDAADGLGEMFG